MPSPHRGCQCYVCKKSGIPLAILQNFPGNPEWENKEVWILNACVIFRGNLCENKDFFSKNLEIQDYILPKKSGNPTSSMGGGQNVSGTAQFCDLEE